MAKNRSRRLRKKMHVNEFQELGFMIRWQFPEGTELEKIDAALDAFIDEVIEPAGLAFDGDGHLSWEGLICLQRMGKCIDEHRDLVTNWLNAKGMQKVEASTLFDIWWDYPKGM